MIQLLKGIFGKSANTLEDACANISSSTSSEPPKMYLPMQNPPPDMTRLPVKPVQEQTQIQQTPKAFPKTPAKVRVNGVDFIKDSATQKWGAVLDTKRVASKPPPGRPRLRDAKGFLDE